MSETTNVPQGDEGGPDAIASPELVHQEGPETLLAAENAQDLPDVEGTTTEPAPGERNEPV